MFSQLIFDLYNLNTEYHQHMKKHAYLIKNNKATNWQEIKWKEVNSRIQDLQNKIVKATLENNMKEVYRLQTEIVSSFEGRALAIRRVVTSSNPPPPLTLPSP